MKPIDILVIAVVAVIIGAVIWYIHRSKKKGRKDLKDHDWNYQYMEKPGALENAEKQYEKYEYYRLSSIAKELYKRQIQANTVLRRQTACLEDKKEQSCQGGNCQRRKRSEHMRWNAYTRTLGNVNRGNIRRDHALPGALCPIAGERKGV